MNKGISRMFAVTLSAVLMLVGLVGLSGCATTSTTEINVFTWAEYFPDFVFEGFTEKTGIKINFNAFTTNEEMLTKLEAVKGGTYDIILASDYVVDIARKQGLIAEIDKSKVPNFKNINPAYQSQFYDPDNTLSVPYAAGTPLIVYDPAKVSIDITGYEDLWNPALKESVVILDDARNMVGVTLKTLGYSFNTQDDSELDQAKEKLMQLKPNVRAFDYDTPHNLMISGEATVGYMFTPQVVTALDERPDLKVVYPKEGMGWGIDSVFVPVDAPNKEGAFAFLDYILDAEIGAQISESALYICCNEASTAFLSEAYLNNKALYIPAEVLGDAEYIMDVGDKSTKFQEIFAEFKQAK